MATTVKTLRARLVADVSQFTKNMDKAAASFEKTGARLRSIGTRVSLGVTAPLVAIGISATKAAAQADIMERRFRAVFKNTSKEATRFSKTLAEATGRSEFQLRGLLASTQNLLVGFGVQTDKAQQLSQQMNQLALDVASFEGVQDEQVVQSFTRALTGEFESLKTLSIVINQARLEQELLNMGVEGGIKAATDYQKALAVQNLILSQTAAAQGKAAEFTSTLEGRVRKVNSAIRDQRILLGAQLAPILDKLLESTQEWIESLNNMDATSRRASVALALIAAAAGPVLILAGLLVSSIGQLVGVTALLAKGLLALAGPLASIAVPVIAVAAAVAAWIIQFKAATVFLRKIGIDVVAIISKMAKDSVKWLQDVLGGVIDWISKKFDALREGLSKLIGALAELPIVGSTFEKIQSMLESFNVSVAEAGSVVKGVYTTAWMELSDDVKDVMAGMTTAFKTQLAEMLKAAGLSAEQIKVALAGFIPPALELGGGETGGTGTGGGETGGIKLGQRFKTMEDALKGVNIAADLLTDSINKMSDGIVDAIETGKNFGDVMKGVLQEVLRGIIKATAQALIFKAVLGIAGTSFGKTLKLDQVLSSGAQSGGFIPAKSLRKVGEIPEVVTSSGFLPGPAEVMPLSRFQKQESSEPAIQVVRDPETIGVTVTRDSLLNSLVIRTKNLLMEDVVAGGEFETSLRQSFDLRRRPV